jgi:uncharacterized protein YndB with AHSA1/START domain
MADILHRVGINAAPKKVYAALARQSGLAGWWTENTTAEPKVGAILEFRFDGGGPDMQVKALRPGKQIKWKCVGGPGEWLGTTLTFDLKKEGKETVVQFSHRGWKKPSAFFRHCSCKWAYFLLSLKSLVEDGRGTPYPHDHAISSWG